jgi:hypothetical protein
MGAVAKSHMKKGFLIYEEMRKYLGIQYMRRPLDIYDFATAPFCISLYMRKKRFLFYQCRYKRRSIQETLSFFLVVLECLGHLFATYVWIRTKSVLCSK